MITAELNAPPIATTLTAALFVLFMGIAPVFWASFSDHYHVRRCLSIASMLIFAVASLGSALITNIWGLVVLRCVQSIGSSCGQSVGAGVIAVSSSLLFFSFPLTDF
jgi:MFS family permease